MAVVESIRNSILDKVLKGVDFATQATHLSLHTADPGTTGTNEVSGGSYARQSVSFASAASGQAVTSNNQVFDDLPIATVTHIGLWTAVSGGTFLWGGPMVQSKTADSGDSIEFPAGNVTAPTTGA